MGTSRNSSLLTNISCVKLGDTCDYSIRLNWGGRRTKKSSQGLLAGSPPPPPVQKTYAEPEPSTLKRSHTFPTTNSSSQTTGHDPTIYHHDAQAPTWHGLSPGLPGHLEYKDGIGHVPRAFSASALFGKGASAVPVPVAAVMGHWSPPGSQAETLPPLPTDSRHVHAPLARHKRAMSLAESSDAMSSFWHSPIMSSPSSYNAGSPCPQLCMAPNGASSVPHGSPATPAVSAFVCDEDDRAGRDVAMLSPSAGLSSLPSTLQCGSAWGSPIDANLLLPPPMPPFHEAGVDDAEAYSFYGFDVAAQDCDIGRNDDDACVPYIGLPARKSKGGVHLSAASLGDNSRLAHRGIGGYYDSPVPILIPRHLEPLPEMYVMLRTRRSAADCFFV